MSSHPILRAWGLGIALGALMLSMGAAACNDDTADDDPGIETMPSTCACPDGVCAEGECVLQITIDPACGDRWGTAQVFLDDLNATTPTGTVSADQPFTSCDPIQAPIIDADGNTVQMGTSFMFIVESEDTRLLSGSDGDQSFTCAASSPFVWRIQCDN
ncbi:MAG: hypothetical protein AAFX99_19800 [Myxococcota bacterium]